MPAPRATYRLQLGPAFGFRAAAAVVPYLAELGISHLYLSPVMQAAEGSMHGYDVVDPERVSEELGGEAGFAALVAAVRAAGLGILLDVVPNHMSIAGARNAWWLDVLENGPASYYATYFDVDWSATSDDRVLLPVLGERYGRALTSGAIAIVRDAAAFAIQVHAQRYPVSPRSVGVIVRRAGERIDHAELAYLGEALAALPSSHERDPAARRRRHRHKAVLLHRLAELTEVVWRAIDVELAGINADPAELDTILEAQNFRLAHWSVATSALTHRRFFDITSLVGIRVEDPDVFDATHARVLAWLRDGAIDGVRIDHVDGLRDPTAYLSRLRDQAGPDAWIVVEKILAPDEQLPERWPVDGTTGYDFLDLVGRMLVDPAGEAPLTRAFTAYTGEAWDPAGERRRARREVMTDALHSELARLTELAARACATSPACRDYTRAEIEDVLAELLAGYGVYRTYLGDGASAPGDRERIAAAAAAALAARPELDRDLVAFLEAALALELPSAEAQELARVAQQTTGPIVAKGDEDTLAYRAVRLLARCDVGADLDTFATPPARVHAALAARAPRALNASSTHDSKRGEDVRARLAVLSELPGDWERAISAWGERAAPGWGDVERDRVFEYVTWQTLVGAWPLSVERAQNYAEKATREARTRTSWRRPDERYEAARTRWLACVYEDRELLDEIERLAARLAPHGDRNALAMLLIKLVAPGVPDFYQGSELRAATLVDPDNRGRVDYGRAPTDESERAKLHVTRRVLSLRARAPALFDAAYRPLAARGPHAERVFAFARGASLVALAPRLGAAAGAWEGTSIELPAGGGWVDALSERQHDGRGRAVPLAEAWRDLPIALLVRTRT